jgi:zinc transporter
MNLSPPLSTIMGSSPFLWAYRFDGLGAAQPYPDPSASDVPAHGEGFIWVHLNPADARSKGWISALDSLPQETRAVFLDDDEHVRLHGGGTTIWGVFSDFGQDPGKTSDTLATIRFALGDRYIVTARRRSVECAETVRNSLIGGRKFAQPTQLLEALVIAIITTLELKSETTINGFNEIEDRVVNDRDGDVRQKLGPLRRNTVALHRQTTALQRVLARFDDPTHLSEAAHAALRRLLQRLESVHHELHAALERARLLHEEVASRQSASINRQLYILTVISTLLLPPTFITGYFGMNAKGLILTENENGALYATLMCVAAAAAAYLILRLIGRKAPNK